MSKVGLTLILTRARVSAGVQSFDREAQAESALPAGIHHATRAEAVDGLHVGC